MVFLSHIRISENFGFLISHKNFSFLIPYKNLSYLPQKHRFLDRENYVLAVNKWPLTQQVYQYYWVLSSYQQSVRKIRAALENLFDYYYNACTCGLLIYYIYIFLLFFLAENNVGPPRSRSGTLSAEGQVWGKKDTQCFHRKK